MEEKIIYDASIDAQMESRSIAEPIREDGKITSYKFRILIRDKEALSGTMTREEVDLMYRFYSSEGANLTQKQVSREFPIYTFQQFKKILRAFNITKASAPFAPHIIEEKTTEDLIQLNFQYKENNYLKKCELEKGAIYEKMYKDTLRSYSDLKQSTDDFKEFIGDLKFDFKFDIKKPTFTNESTLIVYLSDMHIGAEVSEYSVYDNLYNREQVYARMQKILVKILDLTKLCSVTNIVICNVGDSLDGYYGESARGGHILPQNMNNKDQYKTYIGVMLDLFKNLSESGSYNSIKFVCVECGNHDGDFGYVTNKALEAALSYLNPDIEVRIFDKFIEHFTVKNHTFILCHGKDAKDMFKNMPLVLNDKTENQVNEYIDYMGLHGDISFIKGDLHQSATTYGKKFKYRSVGSFFGSSEWIHKNFGNTPASCDIDVVNEDSILETHLLLN